MCKVLSGSRKGTVVFIPRIDPRSADADFSFIFSRRQFPVRISFAMTINKSQGQTLDRVGLDVSEQVFGHGQLYVSCSRGRSFANLKIFSNFDMVKNVVYKEALLDSG